LMRNLLSKVMPGKKKNKRDSISGESGTSGLAGAAAADGAAGATVADGATASTGPAEGEAAEASPKAAEASPKAAKASPKAAEASPKAVEASPDVTEQSNVDAKPVETEPVEPSKDSEPEKPAAAAAGKQAKGEEEEKVEKNIADEQTKANEQATTNSKEEEADENIIIEKEEDSSETKKSDSSGAVVEEILTKLSLDNKDYTTEEKLEALCLVFRETIAENVKYKNASLNITEQLSKNEQTKTALQSLCKALKTQIELKAEEGELKLKEEAQKRLECTQSFETVVKDLTKLIEDNSVVNTKLKAENISLAEKLQELLRSHEDSINKYHSLRQEYDLQVKLFEAQLAKARLEKTEVSANFNEKRLELQKLLLESDEKVTMLMSRETNLKDQLEIYEKQWLDMEKNIGSSTNTFANFRKEMDRLTGQLRKVERDTNEWKNKFEESQQHIQRMNKSNLDREQEFAQLKRKLVAMEKLNRHLHQERELYTAASAGTVTSSAPAVTSPEKEGKQTNGEPEKSA